MAMNLESFHRVVEQLKARNLSLATRDHGLWDHVALKAGLGLESHGLRLNAQGPNADFTTVVAAQGLQAAGGQVTIHSGGKGNIVLLDGGKTQRTPHVSLNLYANNAVVYLNLDHMQPILQRPLALQVTFYNGPDQLFYWGAGSSAVHSIYVIDGRNRTIAVKEDVMMSNDVYFRTHDGHSIVDLETRRLCNAGGDIFLENHVWVGQDVLCLGPCQIGSGSIVAAKALVKGVVPKNVVVGGVPTRVLKENASWSRVPNSLEFFEEEYRRTL